MSEVVFWRLAAIIGAGLTLAIIERLGQMAAALDWIGKAKCH